MQLEQQVISLKLSRKLKNLGVKQDSSFYWFKNIIIGEWCLVSEKDGFVTTPSFISAFTASELGEFLKTVLEVEIEMTGDGFKVCSLHPRIKNFQCENLAEAMGQMLVYLIKEKLI